MGNCFASQTEHEAIKLIINDFDQSIQAKDKSRFLNLFVDATSPMIAVFSEKSMKARRAMVDKINKEENKKLVATRTFVTSPTEMIDGIVSEEVSSREEFDNINIVSDGNIANIYFDYVYYKDNKKQNWGSESWQMVQTLSGWKISSVTYSITSQ
jgi:hypothetical protein